MLSFEYNTITIREGQMSVLNACIHIERGRLERNISVVLLTTDVTGMYPLAANTLSHCHVCLNTFIIHFCLNTFIIYFYIYTLYIIL